MSHQDTFVILLLASRLPFYFYVIYKTYKFRHSLAIIESRLLGITATFAVTGAFVNALFVNKPLANTIGWLFSFFLFLTAVKAKELKTRS